MHVIKRNGDRQDVHPEKITARIENLATGLACDPILVVQKVVAGIFPGVTTIKLDELAAETAAFMSTTHPSYAYLAARIAVSNLHKQTLGSFSATVDKLYNNHVPVVNRPSRHTPLVSLALHRLVMANAARLDAAICHERDMSFDFFGFKTLERAYLLPGERPQYMWMRVALAIHRRDLDAAIETYTMMSTGVFTHATPTLFNAGTTRQQMSSCFLLTMHSDSIPGIYNTLGQCAEVSKYAGGIGLAISDVRAEGSYIAGTNGASNGIVPMLRVFDATARYVDQGGGKRKGSAAIYLEPWHADVEAFLELKKNNGKEERRARDLFYALWTPDLFMRRVEAGAAWSLFCPNEAPGLADVWGEEFDRLYESYEAEPGLARKTMPAQELWNMILAAQVETGTPYMLYKDACNRKSNQRNLGTIKCSNLCAEIVQHCSPEEIAVCNLASISLPAFCREGGVYDFKGLQDATGVVVRNLNKVIDVNFSPRAEATKSNQRHRPIGVGVQGLADAFIAMRYPFESAEARALNRDIFETMYYGALLASVELAKIHGPYETYEGSPMSQGLLQFDLWRQEPNPALGLDWDGLRSELRVYGVYNSLLLALMPTASTSQILGNTEAFEPIPSNIYSRRVLAGDFIVVQRQLVADLTALGLWDPDMKDRIVERRGSIQGIPEIPLEIRLLYKTAFEIKQRCVLDMAADRGAFICQSQSLNYFMRDPTPQKLTSAHFHGWRIGLKTGMYYLRTNSKSDPAQFTIKNKPAEQAEPAKQQEECTTCSS